MELEWVPYAIGIVLFFVIFGVIAHALDQRKPRAFYTRIGDLPPPALQPNASYENTNLVQEAVNGRTIWNPTAVVSTDKNSPITSQHVSLRLNFPERIAKGEKIAINADVSNNHAGMQLSDSVVLEIQLPTGAFELLGPDPITLGPNGDTVSLSYHYQIPYIKGTYRVRLQLLNLQAQSVKNLVVL